MTGQVQACLHCSYSHLWLFTRTSRSTPHTSVTDNYRLSAISKNNTRHCNSSFDMFWSSADTGPVPPLVIYHKNNKNFPVYGTHLVTINDANSRLKDIPRHQSRTPAVSECLWFSVSLQSLYKTRKCWSWVVPSSSSAAGVNGANKRLYRHLASWVRCEARLCLSQVD